MNLLDVTWRHDRLPSVRYASSRRKSRSIAGRTAPCTRARPIGSECTRTGSPTGLDHWADAAGARPSWPNDCPQVAGAPSRLRRRAQPSARSRRRCLPRRLSPDRPIVILSGNGIRIRCAARTRRDDDRPAVCPARARVFADRARARDAAGHLDGARSPTLSLSPIRSRSRPLYARWRARGRRSSRVTPPADATPRCTTFAGLCSRR